VTWFAGELINVFIPGWQPIARADDYVSRWRSPFNARFVRLEAFAYGDEHDGNTQIDALIASIALPNPIDEPPALALLVLAALAARAVRRPRAGKVVAW